MTHREVAPEASWVLRGKVWWCVFLERSFSIKKRRKVIERERPSQALCTFLPSKSLHEDASSELPRCLATPRERPRQSKSCSWVPQSRSTKSEACLDAWTLLSFGNFYSKIKYIMLLLNQSTNTLFLICPCIQNLYLDNSATDIDKSQNTETKPQSTQTFTYT